MKTTFSIIAALAFAVPTFTQAQDTDLKVQRRTLDRQDKLNRPRQNAEELIRGLRITVKNTSLKPQEEGVVEWAILVARPGMQKALYGTGVEKLQPLKVGEAVTFEAGSMPVQDSGSSQQDMEYQVIVKRGGAEVAKAESTATFSQQAESARGAGKKGKKK